MPRLHTQLLLACCALLLLLYYLYSPYDLTVLLRRRPIELKDSRLKYLYQITRQDTFPFIFMEKGQSVFIKNNCTYQNCYVTNNKAMLGDIRLFDAVLFHVPELHNVWVQPARLTTQKYVLVSIESSHYYPICDSRWDSYFNWTWTYRLDSDVQWTYFAVRDEAGRVVAPARDVAWRPHDAMAPVPDTLTDKLRDKSVAAAWLVSNCHALSKREDFVKQLQQELGRFGLRVDIWGRCGGLATNSTAQFLQQVKRVYYFYLAFENSFSEDYVTEKLLHATMNLAVPVVFGDADYTRFLPPHSYLDARALGAAATARSMRDLIEDPTQYAQFHRWRSHYSYDILDRTPETNVYCRFCEMMNSDKYHVTTVYKNMRAWWKGSSPNRC